jgi:hypothetical protein
MLQNIYLLEVLLQVLVGHISGDTSDKDLAE